MYALPSSYTNYRLQKINGCTYCRKFKKDKITFLLISNDCIFEAYKETANNKRYNILLAFTIFSNN